MRKRERVLCENGGVYYSLGRTERASAEDGGESTAFLLLSLSPLPESDTDHSRTDGFTVITRLTI